MKDFSHLPVFSHLDRIADALKNSLTAVIDAEPGAGKTMLVPALIRELPPRGMTILIEPRRIAARSAAAAIAEMHGFSMGKECGFAVRGDQCRCQSDGILAVTPGIYLQMIQRDPLLEGVSAVIFDEFHERSAEADLALAFTLDTRSALRSDLLLTLMSATMESGKIGEFLQAPVIKVPGRGFPVEISYCDTQSADLREIALHTAKAVLANLTASECGTLVFLPGAEEIRRCRSILENAVDPQRHSIHELHGSMDLAAQRAAVRPDPSGKHKIILATNIAESSLTIDGISMVIDSGWEKCAVWHPGAQINFLELRRITADSAAQRAGRAGRTAPGKAVRCYSRLTFENMIPHRIPEILSADLTALRLAVGCWGSELSALRFPDQPPAAATAAAEKVLQKLTLFSPDNRPTAAGKRAASLPLSPRMAAMMIFAPPYMRREAAEFAAILEEKDDFRRFNTANLNERVLRMRQSPADYRIQRGICERLLKEFPPEKNGDPAEDTGVLIAAAFPEWVAVRRSASGTIYQTCGGPAARLQGSDPLRNSEFIAIARLDGTGSADSAIRLAVPISRDALEEYFADRIIERTQTVFDGDSGKFSAFSERCIGNLTLSRQNISPDPQTIIPALIKEALRRQIALPPAEDARGTALTAKLHFAKACGMDELPEINEEFWISLAPFIPQNTRSFSDLKKINWFDILHSAIGYTVLSELDRLYPDHFTAPTGMKFPIDYSGEQPTLAIPVQQLYGVKVHPAVGRKQIPLRIELLSPARRPVQITCDLPGFWRGSWELVRKEMRARYPKHLWHDDPANAAPMKHSVKNRTTVPDKDR